MLLASALLVLVAAVRADHQAPTFNVNLDEPAITRWNDAVTSLIKTHGWGNSYGRIINYLDSIIPRKEWELLDPELRAITAKFKGDYPAEVQGIYDTAVSMGYGNNVTYGQLGFMQLFYEIDNACTSIVARDGDGKIFHSRNLDYSLPGLANITATIAFQSAGKTLFYATQYVGYFGVLTGSRPGGWSVSVNQRFEVNLPVVPVVVALNEGARSVGMFLRDTMTRTGDYAEALAAINGTFLDDPVYITVGGLNANEGAIVTRSRHGCADCGASPWAMDKSNWYRLETNFDHWLPAGDTRRGHAHASMDALAPGLMNSSALFEVLSKPPVLADTTTYTCSMSASLGTHTTVVRDHAASTPDALEHRRHLGRQLLHALLRVHA